MAVNPLHVIMNPKSVVVAGASNNFMKMGSIQALNLINSTFAGEVAVLHPRDKMVLGKPAYKTVAELPFVPELALLVTPAKVTLDLLEELGANGTRHAVISTAGFREMGGEGVHLEERLKEIAQRYGIRFIGPNCMGIINTHIGLNLSVAPYRDKPGKLGLISQSGTYVAQTMPYLRETGVRLSKAFSIGNATSIDAVDCLEYLGEDPETAAIAIYMEGVPRGGEFLRIAREVARRKPIVALYVGGTQTGARSGMSHTGSMGSPDALMDGIFTQAGIIRARNVGEMFGWGKALAEMPVPQGRRMAILTHSGGPATCMADTCEREGLLMPEFSEELQAKIKPHLESTASAKNPVDLTFIVEHESFIDRIPEILFASGEVDGVLMHGVMDTGFMVEMGHVVKNLIAVDLEMFIKAAEFKLDRLVALPHEAGKPMTSSNFLRDDHGARTFHENGIPLYTTPEEAVMAMSALVRYGEIRRRLLQSGEESVEVTVKTLLSSKGMLDEYAAKKLLANYGIPVVNEKLARTLDEALSAAELLGYPVVLKGLPEGIAHKTEAGLVHLNLQLGKQVEQAFTKVREAAPGCPVVVSKMLTGKRELVVGMTRFTGFGPCVMLGIGGIFTEAMRDITFRAAPVAENDALAMPDSLRLKNLFASLRGMPAVDRKSLAHTIQAVGRLALEHPEIKEIDINPLIVVDGIPTAVDALIFVE